MRRSPFELRRAIRIRAASRCAGVLLVISIVVLTVVPPSARPETPLPHVLEHALIFLVTGLPLGMGYARREKTLCVGAVVFCAAIEVSQLFVPGRHARLADFITDAIATLSGVELAFVIVRLAAAARPNVEPVDRAKTCANLPIGEFPSAGL